jgi:hypothetical protein
LLGWEDLVMSYCKAKSVGGCEIACAHFFS